MTKCWLQHVKEIIKKNPGLSLEICVQIADTTYYEKIKKRNKK